MLTFNRPPYTGNEEQHVITAMRSSKVSGDGDYSRRCERWFQEGLACRRALLTPSCTQALEMAAILIDIQPGDEVIMPSYTFVSTANAFALRGAKVVFVDIRPDTMNIDESLVEDAITAKTRAIVPVHYAGVGCEMDKIMDIANRHDLWVIEDAAQGMTASYKSRPLGTIGHLGAYSFHETKNFTSGGEGGLLIINDSRFVERAEIIREKGTNRSQFFRGMVDKYTWVDIGSSYLPSELQAAYLWGQLEKAEEIKEKRLALWRHYRDRLDALAGDGYFELGVIPSHCAHNGHMVYLKVHDLDIRMAALDYLNKNGIYAVFHYMPLHSSPAGKKLGRFHGEDRYTTIESERLLRLPMFHSLEFKDVDFIVKTMSSFFKEQNAICC